MGPDDPFHKSCENFRKYPKCLVRHEALTHTAEAYYERLINQSGRLFNERQAAVDLLEVGACAQGTY